ncbi:MAG: TonB-dependent receptor [Candidatus Aureabacteria bacterium]|nr:TonB-dependent receptor [Candidatus Auribacterota bacterium]
MKKLFLYLMTLMLATGCSVYAQQANIAEEGLEYLLFEEIPIAAGTLTQTQKEKSPVSTTVIDKEKIALAPVRNLYDLLEMFVPGFQTFTHFDSTHMGLRGLVIDRDYTWLLLVNGVLANQRSHAGVVTEMENWDINDIEKVEVIRGPGSVTYGPGAVAGVISITTKNASVVQKGTVVGVQYVTEYSSKGIHLSNSFVGDNFGLYSYVSYTATDGQEEPDIFTFAPPSVEARYVSPMVLDTNTYVSPVLEYYPDYLDRAQIKAYAELALFKEFKIWGRYTRSGTSRMVVWAHSTGGAPTWFYQRNNNGDWENSSATGVQQCIFAGENNHVFSDDLSLKTTLSYSNIDQERTDQSTIEKGNYVENYSESRILLKSILKYNITEKIKSAFGFELAKDSLDQGWGDDDEDEFIMDDGVLFVSRPGSPALAARSWIGTDRQVYLTSADMSSYAFLAEMNFSLTPEFDIMLSGRADKYEFSDMSFSPRLSLIYNNETAGLFKFNIQRSIRENTTIQLISADYFNNQTPEPEEFDGLEFIYKKNVTPQFSAEVALFYSKADLLGWNSGANAEGDPRATTTITGSLTLGGVDVTLQYKTEDEKYIYGLNHAYSAELDFELAADQSGSYLSRSDSNNLDQEGVRRYSTGDDRMNWANHVTKFYTIMKLTEKLTLFNSMRVVWEYEGNKNWMKMYEEGSVGTSVQTVTQDNLDKMEGEDIFEMDFRFDLALSYKITEPWSVTLYGQNLLKLTKNWRYVYIMEGGAAVDEPTVIGIKSSFTF